MCCLILPEVTVLIATQMCIWFVRPFKDVFTGDVDKGDPSCFHLFQLLLVHVTLLFELQWLLRWSTLHFQSWINFVH